MTELVEVGFEADRLCDAIAKIGYEPHSAVMDIVDNSISAGASSIRISLHLQRGKSLHNKNAVSRYQIVDNGGGMDDEGVQRAFDLGSRRAYPSGSLSKYGLGLKSAGLSLGSRITIVSKRQGRLTDAFSFDKDIIADKKRLLLERTPLSEDERKRFNELITGDSGTVVEISGSERVNHPSPNATVGVLKKRLGVVYYAFLSNPQKPVALSVAVVTSDGDVQEHPIVPMDILFLDKSVSHFDPDTYDFCSPCLALDDAWTLTDRDGNDVQAHIYGVAFPQHGMSGPKSPLNDEQRAQVKGYEISGENAGFFIYRNGRLIRWGDPVEKLITKKEEYNLRIRLDLPTELDDILHVDVSKQRLEMDDEAHASLFNAIKKAKQVAGDIRERCAQLLNQSNSGAGESFTASTEHVAEDDPTQASKGEEYEETVRRRQDRSKEKPAEAAESDGPGGPEEVQPTSESVFRKIRYSDNVRYGQLYQPFYDPRLGVFVCVNKQHPYYQDFINRLPESSPPRLAIEALIFAAGLAESNTRFNHTDLTPERIEAVFNRFHRNLASWLDDWTQHNADRND